MEAPPFRLAREAAGPAGSRTLHPLHDLCCQPAAPAKPAPARRLRLAELDTNIHCSVIGTCLTTGELRRLVPRFVQIDRERASDLDIHHAAVQLAGEGGAGAKALNKALDARYDAAIRRFQSIRDADELKRYWSEALSSGDVPPAYWAVMTHPFATVDMRQLAFGDVHMLSHLVGAANRADIRRLVALEAENAELRARLEQQQGRVQELGQQRDALRRQLDAQASQAASAPPRDTPNAALADELAQLRAALADAGARLALQTQRCEAAEQRGRQQADAALSLQARLDDALDAVAAMQDETEALEQTLMQAVDDAGDGHAGHAGRANSDQRQLASLQGKRVVYVGGRPGAHVALKRLVESAGGRLVVHDGGIEDRKGMLAAVVPGADMVVFPVDCIDHDSMNMVKRVCERHQVAWRPLRSASVASFLAWAAQVSLDGTANPCQTGSSLCLRHA